MSTSSIISSVKDFLRLADIGRSRSSILNQLQWIMVLLIAGIVVIQFAHSPSWLSIFLAVLLALDAVVIFIAFLYFMLKRPHSLRSESFDYKMSELIQRREGDIESGLYDEISATTELKWQASSDSPKLAGPEEK
jgi:hypothetical protein